MLTRRLHVSGLTPAISENDLKIRFSAFGTVKAIDGVGKLDALGQPRKFAYVSLETAPDKYAKCMNVLSGSTWKGTRLRIGEAKPNYEQRLSAERAEGSAPTKKRRRISRGVHGVEAKDMSLVTLDNVKNRPGWTLAEHTRLVRPLRMRPLHPIEKPGRLISRGTNLKKRKRKLPLVRQRRQKIDPTQFGAVRLTEDMLQAELLVVVAPPPKETSATLHEPPSNTVNTVKHAQNHEQHRPPLAKSLETLDVDFVAEHSRDLALLTQLFEGKEEWDGREDDIDENGSKGDENASEAEEAINTPNDAQKDETNETNTSDESDGQESEAVGQAAPTSTTTLLKDLFLPANSAPTSLFAGMDLDLALDDEFSNWLDSGIATQAPGTSSIPHHARSDTRIPLEPEKRKIFDASTKDPYFFPLRPDEQSRGKQRDIFSVADSKGWKESLLNPASTVGSLKSLPLLDIGNKGTEMPLKGNGREGC
ncbi:hypothetical protein CPB86DRAFT_579707 [Serendipita vermifera]|nr:hypothetical protein CPB86DRAFT_579707 [Serendipita vermifera]